LARSTVRPPGMLPHRPGLPVQKHACVRVKPPGSRAPPRPCYHGINNWHQCTHAAVRLTWNAATEERWTGCRSAVAAGRLFGVLIWSSRGARLGAA
jgi:hypothetical protein